MVFSEDMIIGDILDKSPDSIKAFQAFGMGCMHCPAARGETIREACEIHSVDAKKLIEALNA